MNRWLPILALCCAACAPDPICDIRRESCGPIIDDDGPYWTTIPEILAPGESVVEVIPSGGYVEVPRRKFYGEPGDEPQPACVLIRPVAVFSFRVTRTVAGDFRGRGFNIQREGGSCGSDNRVQIDTFMPRRTGGPLYLVIRPVAPSADVSATFPPTPLMTYRPTSLPIQQPETSPLEPPTP